MEHADRGLSERHYHLGRNERYMKFTFKITVENEGRRMDQWLVGALKRKASRSEIRRLIETQIVLVNGKAMTKGSYKLKLNDEVELDVAEKKPYEVIGEQLPLDIVYQNERFLVINKPCGWVVHPGAGNRTGTLVHALKGASVELSDEGGEERPGIVHRIDKETSGLLLVAKDNVTHRQLSNLFSSREIHKEYQALVRGQVEFKEGRMDAPLGRDPKHRVKMAVVTGERGKEAMTDYRREEIFRYSTLVRLFPKTGRTHQIRVHLAHLGHPVLGDSLYGRGGDASRMALHANRIEFVDPVTNETMTFELPLPPDFVQIMDHEKQRV